jgi:hypothetical protein
MTKQIKYSRRLEIRLSSDEMDTLNKMSKDRKIGKSSFIRILIEKEDRRQKDRVS